MRFDTLYSSFVTDRHDHKLFVMAILCFLAAVGIGIYDVVTIVLGTVDPNVHLPFLLAAAFAAFGGIILAILRHGARLPESPQGPSEGPYRDPYRHPDHRPHGRINAPDDTSD